MSVSEADGMYPSLQGKLKRPGKAMPWAWLEEPSELVEFYGLGIWEGIVLSSICHHHNNSNENKFKIPKVYKRKIQTSLLANSLLRIYTHY